MRISILQNSTYSTYLSQSRNSLFLFVSAQLYQYFPLVSLFSSLLIGILFSFVLCCWEDWESVCVYVRFVNELPDPSAALSNMGSQLRGHKSNFKDEIKINWNAHQLRTLAGIYLQTDKFHMIYTDLGELFNWINHTHSNKNFILVPWIWRKILIGLHWCTLLLCLWLGVKGYASAPLSHVTELLIMILDIWPLKDKGQVGNVLRFTEHHLSERHNSICVHVCHSQKVKVYSEINIYGYKSA